MSPEGNAVVTAICNMQWKPIVTRGARRDRKICDVTWIAELHCGNAFAWEIRSRCLLM